MMELQHLRYFVGVAENRSFTRAAEELLVTQPALSKQIRRLESELGLTLFQRGPGQITLTHEGELLLPYAQAMLSCLDGMTSTARDIQRAQRRLLALGYVPNHGARHLTRIVPPVRQRHPEIEFRFHESGRRELLILLKTGAIDLAIIPLPPENPGLKYVTLETEEFVVVLPRGHPLADRSTLTIRDLQDESFLLPEVGVDHRRLVEEEARLAGFNPRIVHESRGAAALQALVACGYGITVMTPRIVRGDLDLITRPLISTVKRTPREIVMAYSGDRELSGAARQVFALVKGLYRESAVAQGLGQVNGHLPTPQAGSKTS